MNGVKASRNASERSMMKLPKAAWLLISRPLSHIILQLMPFPEGVEVDLCSLIGIVGKANRKVEIFANLRGFASKKQLHLAFVFL